MKVWALLVFFCGSVLLQAADPSIAFNREIAVETFETETLREFPQRWSALKDAQVAQGIYRIAEEDGNRFLRAHAEKQGILIALSHAFQSKAFPFLRWRWRATQLPPGGDERV